MSQINYLTASTAEILKQRFKEVQRELKKTKCIKLTDFREFALDREPSFNCPKGWDKIKSVWYGYSTDIRLTEIMQEYKVELKTEKA